MKWIQFLISAATLVATPALAHAVQWRICHVGAITCDPGGLVPTAAVPEPSAALVMVVGLAIAGLASRRR